MNEPVSLILARVERHLGLVRAARWRDDPDCPPPEVLEWLAAFDPLYETLPPAPPSTDAWTDLRTRLAQRHGRAAVRFWRATALGLGLVASVLGALLWTAPSRTPQPVIVQAKPAPAPPQRLQAAGLFATMQQVKGGTNSLFVLVATPRGTSIHSTPADVALHPGHTYHLWADDGTRAILIGVVSPSISHSVEVATPDRDQVRPGSQLMVTLDPDDAAGDFRPSRIVARGVLGAI